MTLTDEELLKLLETAEESDGPVEYSNNVIPFLTRYDIKEGNDKVPFRILYKLYKTYIKDFYPPREFKRCLHDVIIPQGRDATRFYMLNISAMKVSKEYYRILSKKKISGFERAGDIKHITSFIERYNLGKGSSWIEGMILYDLYKERFRELKHKPKFGPKRFVRLMKLFFDSKQPKHNGSNWFGVNESYKEFISPEKIEAIRKGGKETRRSKKDKEGKSE